MRDGRLVRDVDSLGQAGCEDVHGRPQRPGRQKDFPSLQKTIMVMVVKNRD